MSFKKRQNEAGKKRMEKLIYLAKEDPDTTYDLSQCDMVQVPSGTYTFFKMLRKETLLLYSNRLSSLSGGGKLDCLMSVRVLDLHDNELTSLPDEICSLTLLQILRVDKNKLKQIPAKLGALSRLQSFNCSDNPIRSLPESFYSLRSLRTLDVSETRIQELDKRMCRLRALETLLLTAAGMRYPPRDVCERGTEAIVRFLCQESGVAYEPPTASLLQVLDTPAPPQESDVASTQQLQESDRELQKTISLLDKMKYEQQQSRLLTHEALQRQKQEEAALAASSLRGHSDLVKALAQEQNRLDAELDSLGRLKQQQRSRLVDSVIDAEQSASQLISELTTMQERAATADRILEQLESERMQLENWVQVHQAEAEQIRKHDIIRTMEQILQENEAFQRLLDRHMQDRDFQTADMQASESAAHSRIENIVENRRVDQEGLVADLMQQEELQKAAFLALQRERDERCCRLVCQIELVQRELLQLTLLECERRRQKRSDEEELMLAQQRIDLGEMLMNLMEQREQREQELLKRLTEMEEARDESQAFYWLVQYQRLLDRKPQAMIDRETNLEIAVVTIVKNAGGAKYLPLFALRRITIESLCQLSEPELSGIGVREASVRRLIIRGVEAYRKSMAGNEKTDVPLKKSSPEKLQPSAPTADVTGQTTLPAEVTTRREGECVVCMEKTPFTVFLPCGHICCCSDCAVSLHDCPLCRQRIQHKLRLEI